MKKRPVIFVLSSILALLLISFAAHAIQSSISNYYPSPSDNFTKVHLINASGGPDENSTASPAPYCQWTSAGGATHSSPGTSGVTFINAGTIFSDPVNGNLEICQKNGEVSSSPGACFYRFTTGTPSCPTNYSVVPVPTANTNTIPGNGAAVTAFQCCFTNTGHTGSDIFAKSGCFSIFGVGYPASSQPAACSSVDASAYDTGCQAFVADQNIDVRTCCYNMSGTDLSAAAASGCPSLCSTSCGNGTCHTNSYTTCAGTTCPADCNSPYSCTSTYQCCNGGVCCGPPYTSCCTSNVCTGNNCNVSDTCGVVCTCASGSCVLENGGNYGCTSCVRNCNGAACGASDGCGSYCMGSCASPSECFPANTPAAGCGGAPCCSNQSYCTGNIGAGWYLCGGGCCCVSNNYDGPPVQVNLHSGPYAPAQDASGNCIPGVDCCVVSDLTCPPCYYWSGVGSSGSCLPTPCPTNMWCNPEVADPNQRCQCVNGTTWNGSSCGAGGCTAAQCNGMNPPEICVQLNPSQPPSCCTPACNSCSASTYSDGCGGTCAACTSPGQCCGNTCCSTSCVSGVCSGGGCNEDCNPGTYCYTNTWVGNNHCAGVGVPDCQPSCPSGYTCSGGNGAIGTCHS